MKYVITAAYGGIGSALSRRLAAKGHEMMLIGRNGDKLAALCAEVNAQYVVTDLTNLDHVEAGVQRAASCSSQPTSRPKPSFSRPSTPT